ncbi:hypothetical protein LEP1GSC036_0371 [Leptospira weilii str. 2006001853]|uniref:Uncharacterized protein n=1 Tax=Leptospira weilii str. 2006001853 TaxID=1001589 RepID=A0A828Z500_9LEPT|nr:hypothetical protein LEP1GSC036_0371 [Leptospira weilii str. 2006001853]
MTKLLRDRICKNALKTQLRLLAAIFLSSVRLPSDIDAYFRKLTKRIVQHLQM